MKKLPLARTMDIVVQTLGNEILIYDLTTHKAFNLSETSSIVYQACNGKTTFAELRAKNKFTDAIIFLAIDELNKENLLEKSREYTSPFIGLSRREAIRKVGLASMIALPVISTLVAPAAAMAQSGGGSALRANGQACTTGSQCTSNICTGGKCCSGTYTAQTSCTTIGDCCFGGNGIIFCDTNAVGTPNVCCSISSCVKNADCCAGETCQFGSCRVPT